jgi:hypothetical protein
VYRLSAGRRRSAYPRPFGLSRQVQVIGGREFNAEDRADEAIAYAISCRPDGASQAAKALARVLNEPVDLPRRADG